jgi:hypothetical protein
MRVGQPPQEVQQPMATQPHQPARKIGGGRPDPDALENQKSGYPDVPGDEPGLTGGPATESVPGSHRETTVGVRPNDASPLDAGEPGLGDGGEATMPGRPRETGGNRPPKAIPKTEGS